MKRVFLVFFVFFCAAGVSLHSWEAEDLKTYPEGIKPGTLIFNIGTGLGHFNFSHYAVLPLFVEGEVSVPLGGLPFGMGAIITYSADKYNNYHHYLGIQFRILYHFNWLIPKLDTYAAVDTGWVLHLVDGPETSIGFPDIGLNLGGRYFFVPVFGVFGEITLPMTEFFWPDWWGHLAWFKGGISLKF
ncbi:MAG: hypothetical protein LBF77_11265 [Spirochaetaceae bacterium]|nr:hypothetical protein [Spirochaetaceae bacterium]